MIGAGPSRPHLLSEDFCGSHERNVDTMSLHQSNWKGDASSIAPAGHPAGMVELSDDEMLDEGGWTWVAPLIFVTVTFCSPNGTACGSCSWGTRGCC